MRIAVIAAMAKELALLVPLIEGHRLERVATAPSKFTEYHLGAIGEHEIVAVMSGIGKVNAALATKAMIDRYHPDLVINSGVAGGVGRTKVLDVVIPEAVAYHDVWCGPGTEWGEAAGCPRRLKCSFGPGAASVPPMNGLLASGDIFVSQPEEVEHILRVWPDAVGVDMESAAIAQTCWLNGVDFACIRVISDTPGGDDNIAQYETFWDDAPRATFAALERVLRAL